MKKKFSFGLVWKSLKDAFTGFGDDKVTKLSAALAYYTGFSLAPLLVVIIAICGFFFGREAVQGTIDNQIQSFIGADAAKQIQDMIKNAAVSGKGTVATIIGVVTLLIGATTIFGEIQDSINSIWGLKPKPKVGIMKTLQTRLLSFGLIASLGFLLLVSLAATSVVEGIGDRLRAMLPDLTVVLFYIINLVLTLSVTTILFAIIFKVLPDAKIKWKDIWPGAIATSLLFLIGKFGISLYISKSNIGSTYGAAGSLAVILVWIYYSAIILYFGAEFTKAYALNKGAQIIPNHYAQWTEEATVPNAEPKTHNRERKEPPVHSPSPSDNAERHVPQYAPQLAVTNPPVLQSLRPEKRKGPGMGTVLFGLAVYYIDKAANKKRGQ
jgi:membrane protein